MKGAKRRARTRMENAILRNLLAETLRFQDQQGADPGAPEAHRTPRRAVVKAEPEDRTWVYRPVDPRTENAVLRRLLVTTGAGYDTVLEERTAERSLCEVLLAEIGAAVVHIDCSARVIEVNRVAATFLGSPAAELAGRPLAEVVRLVTGDGGAVDLDLSPCLHGGRSLSLRQHLMLEGSGGRRRAVTGRATALRDRRGEVAGGVLILRPVAEEG